MLGSILGNILLVLGSSFIAGGFTREHGEFQVTAAQTSVVFAASVALSLSLCFLLTVALHQYVWGSFIY
jgi:Ca2+:H+ antiporter